MQITRRHLRRLIREVVLAEKGSSAPDDVEPGGVTTTTQKSSDTVQARTSALGSPISTLDVEESRVSLEGLLTPSEYIDQVNSQERAGNRRGWPECCTSTLKLYVAGSDRGLITSEIGLGLLNIIASSLRSELYTFQGIEHLEIDPTGEEAVSVVYQDPETVSFILSDPANFNRQKSKIRSLLPDLEEQIIDFLEHSAGAYRRVSSPGRLRRHRLDLKLVVTIDHQADAYGDDF